MWIDVKNVLSFSQYYSVFTCFDIFYFRKDLSCIHQYLLIGYIIYSVCTMFYSIYLFFFLHKLKVLFCFFFSHTGNGFFYISAPDTILSSPVSAAFRKLQSVNKSSRLGTPIVLVGYSLLPSRVVKETWRYSCLWISVCTSVASSSREYFFAVFHFLYFFLCSWNVLLPIDNGIAYLTINL